ncbi:hypothetical protein N7449_003271 [Penicillium cf. viridicatum]|uniref:C2H2-type domain-containing protein n=1 Tax=Penicillium cf. viridicatum TaxID=2972119 RepID=A0A9W9T478_9EURO|nr:hypothetical protein N7449_003271 [Penicillium cf. viridicatum]
MNMNEMNEMNRNTSTSGMTSGVDQNRPFPCDQCPKLFTRSENLQRHKRARKSAWIFLYRKSNIDALQGHGGASRKNFQCSRCHARFSRRSSTCINDMVIVAARQDPQFRHLSRRYRGWVCIPPRQWSAYRHL